MPPQNTPKELRAKEESIISGLLPTVSGGDIVLNDEGWDNRAYIVNNGEYVFKFPRSDEIRGRQSKEIAAIRTLENIKSDLAFPKITWEGKDHSYFAYTGVKGRNLGVAIESLDPQTLGRLGTQIGTFLKQLHAKKLDEAVSVSVDDEIKFYQKKYRFSLEIIVRRFSVSEQEKIKHFAMVELPNTMKKLGSESRLCHGDLGTYNMIIDADSNLGVIDFGDTNYYDQSKDFIGLDNPMLMDAALSAYGDTTLLRDKIAIRRKANRAFDLPYYISKNDPVGLEQGLKIVRQELL
ncbi:MAG TPA: aminoglycoside phosphotransferase family protein [Verrucomicrobiae bacterium]|nr:aminoglycoside phosphotransferase family protein [Verrucomicrobiae bacterium]